MGKKKKRRGSSGLFRARGFGPCSLVMQLLGSGFIGLSRKGGLSPAVAVLIARFASRCSGLAGSVMLRPLSRDFVRRSYR